MAGTFEGLSDWEWKLCAARFPPEPATRGHGMPQTSFRRGINPWLSSLITGCRWCDLPRGPHWASKSAAHRGRQRWQADGPRAAMPARLLGLAEERGMIRWPYGGGDGAFAPWHRRR
jgi:transposase